MQLGTELFIIGITGMLATFSMYTARNEVNHHYWGPWIAVAAGLLALALGS